MASKVENRLRELPAWPLVVVFAGYGVWWMLGLGAFALPLLAIPMALLLARGGIRVPNGFGAWLLFLVFMLTSVVAVDSSLRLIGFLFRAANYLAATLVFLYIYNSKPERVSDRLVISALIGYWGWVTIGGLLGVLQPFGSIGTPVEHLLSQNLVRNEYVHQLVHPRFAEIQQPWGAPHAYIRPSAPFPFTNAWGCNFALLLPFVALGLSRIVPPLVRTMTIVLLPLSVVAAFATLNRGMFLAVGVGAVYVAIRLAMRGNVRVLFGLVSAAVIGVTAASASGVFQHIAQRTTFSNTTSGRQTIYAEAFDRTLHSPIFGYGAPRPSLTLPVSVGTQGHIWNVMFSYGFPALGLFLGWFLWSAWRTRRFNDPVDLALHTAIVMACVMVLFYGFDGPQLEVAFVAMALVLRRRRLDEAPARQRVPAPQLRLAAAGAP